MTNLLNSSLIFSRKFKKISFIPKFIRMVNRVVFSCDIPPEAEIHPSVVFAHSGLGTVVNKNAKIGAGTKVLQNVTIGGAGQGKIIDGKKVVAPQIGEHVVVGAGSQILGAVIIGDNVIIGAGSVVTKDVPDNVAVVGVPARIIRYHKIPNPADITSYHRLEKRV